MNRTHDLTEVTSELAIVQQNFDNVEKELFELQKQLDQIAALEVKYTEELASVEKQLKGEKKITSKDNNELFQRFSCCITVIGRARPTTSRRKTSAENVTKEICITFPSNY